MEILLHFLTDHFDLAVSSLSEFVYDHVRVVSTEVVKKDWNSETDRAPQVALAVSSADEKYRDVVVVTDHRPLFIVLLQCLAADVAINRVFILLPMLGTNPLHRSIRPKLFHDRRLPLD